MNCATLEALICDYADGTLDASGRATVEAHLAKCENCAALAKDAVSALAFIQTAAVVEPPPELVNRILFQIPRGHSARQNPANRWWRRLLQPVLQPRFAMGMAMTILSVSMLGRFAGISPRQLTPADLRPAAIWEGIDDRMHRAWERARKFYASLRVVYEVQAQLREWTLQEEEEDSRIPESSRDAARAPETGTEIRNPGMDDAL